MKLQCDREQTAHLQTALLHLGGCGPRFEPLSRAPSAYAAWQPAETALAALLSVRWRGRLSISI